MRLPDPNAAEALAAVASNPSRVRGPAAGGDDAVPRCPTDKRVERVQFLGIASPGPRRVHPRYARKGADRSEALQIRASAVLFNQGSVSAEVRGWQRVS